MSSFTVVVLGDTQSYVASDELAHGFERQVQWIVRNEHEANIAFVTQVGDLVERPGDVCEWRRAERALAPLDASGIAWSTAVGNHDVDRAAGATRYLRSFGPERHAREPWFGGASDNGLNTWQRFSAGGLTFLHLALEFDAPDEALAWAAEVLEHPDNTGCPTVLTTHVYLNDNTGRTHFDSSPTTVRRIRRPYVQGAGRNSGDQIWQKLIHGHSQIFLVLCGHYRGERMLASTNAAGGTVYQLQVDYSRRPRGGDGWLKLLCFDLGAATLHVRTYSPTRDEYQEFDPELPEGNALRCYRGGEDSVADGHAEFVLPLALERPGG